MTRFSVIIPLYNKAPHIERSLGSVLKQDYNDFQIIVVDDGSTDGGIDLVLSYADSDQRIQVFHRGIPGPGGYAARNLGIEKSNGEWIVFLDADDEWLPGFLSELDRIIAEFPQAGFISAAYLIDNGRESLRLSSFALKNKNRIAGIISPLDYCMFAQRNLWPTHTSSAAARRDALLSIGGFPVDRCQRGGDRDTWFRLIFHVPFVWTPFRAAIYHTDSVNMVTRTVSHPAKPCITFSILARIKDLTNDSSNYKLIRVLKKLHDASLRSYLKQRSKSGDFSIEDLSIFLSFPSLLFVFRLFLVRLFLRRSNK